ncbi:MAG: DmsE family decaheme c-type cytochrome [Acidobacteria bacterium]|nr:DmsE family decaheme c-type cytochrome [Acidobacteriota bacterium]
MPVNLRLRAGGCRAANITRDMIPPLVFHNRGSVAFLWGPVTVLLLLILALGAGPARAQAPPEKVGNETCLSCHDVEPTLSRTPHAAKECENCHGPGSTHVENGGDLSLSFRANPAPWAVTQCLSCHQSNTHLTAFRASAHGRNSVACVSCHQVHQERAEFGLLKKDQAAVCTDCHPATRAELRKPFHHPVLEGAMRCSDCHQPHLEERRPLRRLVHGSDDSCLSCHSDKKGPFIFEHAAVTVSGCETCHQPHGSVNAKLLRRTQVHQLCLECHSRTPGVAGKQPPAFHDIRTARFRNCTTCHREIHGSNASRIFFR